MGPVWKIQLGTETFVVWVYVDPILDFNNGSHLGCTCCINPCPFGIHQAHVPPMWAQHQYVAGMCIYRNEIILTYTHTLSHCKCTHYTKYSSNWPATIATIYLKSNKTDTLINKTCYYPDSTPRTKLSMKNDPIMMSGMKYIQFHALPDASLLWNTQTHTHKRSHRLVPACLLPSSSVFIHLFMHTLCG